MAASAPVLAPPMATPNRKSHFLSGGLGGLLSAIIVQPADLLKTRLQQSPHRGSASATLLSTLRTIAAGPSPIRALWRGTLPSVIRTGAGSAIYFSTLNFVRTAAGGRRSAAGGSSSLPVLGAWTNLLAGAGTRAAVGFAVMPVTVLKVRYESSLYAYTSLGSAVRDVLRHEGVRGFFAGWGATAVRDAPYAGLYVLFYEQAKKVLGGRRTFEANEAMAVNAVAGAGAAAAATAVTNPFDVLKTRIQVNPDKYRNMWTAARVLLSEKEGRWRGRALWDGLGLRVARKAVSSALAWGVYERMIR